MIFGSPIYGGPLLDKLIHREFILHDAGLTYAVPDGAAGADSENKRIINYRQEFENFKRDGNSGRDYYQIDGAVWVYFNKHLLHRFFPQEVGSLSYTIGINRLLDANDCTISGDYLDRYVHSFIDDFLEGPNGINTQIRRANPDSDDEELLSILALKPEKIEKINSKNHCVNFTLRGYPSRKSTQYFFMALNDDFALSIEFVASNSGGKEKVRKIIDDRNDKAIRMIMNSIEIELG